MPKKSKWIKLSEQQPGKEDRYKFFFILYQNPHWISKFSNIDIPKYLPETAMWIGDQFDATRIKPLFWMPVPELPQSGE